MKHNLIIAFVVFFSAALLSCKNDASTTSSPPSAPGATHLVLGGVPNPIAAGATFVLAVRALRDDETLDPHFNENVIIAKSNGPGALNGVAMRLAVGGIATFDNLSLSTIGDISLSAYSATLTATTAPIMVIQASGGPATKLEFSILPAMVLVDSVFSPMVRALRADNSLDSAYTEAITISVDNGPGTLSGTTTQPAINGVSFFPDLTLSATGTVILRAASGMLTGATSTALIVNAASPTVLRVGIFSGQNGYSTSGSLQILRQTNGTEVLMTGSNFSVSGGAGSIGVWLTNSAGAINLNGTAVKIRLATLTSGFGGVYTFTIPGGLGDYTHAVTFCESASINFGSAQLTNP